MTNDQQVEQVEISIKEAKKKISDRDMLRGLLKNRAFKRIILEKYLEEEAIRLVHMKSEPMDEINKENVNNMMFGIGSLDRYFRHIMAEGSQMEAALIENEEVLEELAAEVN